MFLRSLTMKGFKSFAGKTTLEFTPGISVIVGPNGSGKSNIADAVAWVLGEQGPGALRGGQMADVIFAGSPSRPPLGMAEVSLVIDNTAGLIPVPATEIEISRAIYRSGESEYRLSGRPCRLLDIQELLSDTGMGRGLHTVISQGHLDDVLSARPEERRQFVEEAAGIAKHRRRRERAERKLAGLQQDLLRLQDVLSELRRRLKPLKQQAELAARHETLTREAEELTTKLAGARLRDLYGDRERRTPSWRETEALRLRHRERMADLDREIERLDREQASAEVSRRDAEERYESLVEEKSRAEARLRTAIRAEARAKERFAAVTGRSGRLFALEEELGRTEQALAGVRASTDRREAELEEAEGEFRRAERARRDAEDERRRLEAEASARRAEAEALARTVAGDDAEAERLAVVRAELRARIASAESRFEELQAEVERLDASETPLAEELGRLDRERGGLARTLAELEPMEQGLLARRQVVDARAVELSESPGSAFARLRGDVPLGVLGNLIDAPPDLRPALRAALGPFVDAVVYGTEREALAEARAQGAAGLLLAAGDVAPVPRSAGVGSAPGPRLVDRVRPDPRVRALTVRLLDKVYLVHNLAEAEARHRAHPECRFVTADGIVVGPAFVQAAPGHDRRLEEIRRESGALDRELSSVRRRIREGRARLQELTGRAEGVRLEVDQIDAKITAAAEEMSGIRSELASLRREDELVTGRSDDLRNRVTSARDRLDALPSLAYQAPALPPIPEPPVHLRVEVEALRRERARLEAGAARARAEIERSAAEDPVALRTLVTDAAEERTAAEAALEEAEETLEAAAAVHRKATEAARRAQARAAASNRAWREQAAEVDRLRGEFEQDDRARADLERRIADAERVLSEGHGADPRAVVESLGAEDTVEALQRQSDLVSRRLGLIGRVNLLAAGELEALQERHDFMVRELEDVRAARADLEHVIAAVDRQMAEMFRSAFHDVAAEFAGLFGTMFPGGEGRITLTDPDDPLASGIDVEARPGRKRVRRLSLLSGGERSLAALAFLFAIFRARPSPFYLMDEVEAALDDVNLHRFLEVVKGFAARSQILVVTHQKRTMETADVLYGVSMGSDGASTVISQRLAEVAART